MAASRLLSSSLFTRRLQSDSLFSMNPRMLNGALIDFLLFPFPSPKSGLLLKHRSELSRVSSGGSSSVSIGLNKGVYTVGGEHLGSCLRFCWGREVFSHCRGPNPTSIKQWQINIISKNNIKFRFWENLHKWPENNSNVRSFFTDKNIFISDITVVKPANSYSEWKLIFFLGKVHLLSTYFPKTRKILTFIMTFE
jgi:hypothetical protein